jgi:hypothetical protein
MPHRNGSGDLAKNIQNLPKEIKASMELIGVGEELIPVQLPEGPAKPLESSVESPDQPKSSVSMKSCDPTSPERSRKSHPGSPLDVFRHPNIPLDSPSSPRSDFSRNSEDSVIIVGDTFSAPINLQFSMDSSPHIRDAGGEHSNVCVTCLNSKITAFDRYSRTVNQPLSTYVSIQPMSMPTLTSLYSSQR